MDENIEKVTDLMLSQHGQQNKPKTQRYRGQISSEAGIHRSTVHMIIFIVISAKMPQKTSCADAVRSQSRRPSENDWERVGVHSDDIMSLSWIEKT